MHLKSSKFSAWFLLSALIIAKPVYAFGDDDISRSKLIRMEQSIQTMENSLSEHPTDRKLEKRYKKALILYDRASACIKFADETEAAPSIEVPTAGISSVLGKTNSTDFWLESYSIYADECLSLETESDFFHGFYNISKERKKIVNTALSCEGKISYLWGGKPVSKAWDESWEMGEGGLDCSGFITWVYWNATDTENENEELLSTYAISANQSKISYEELLPGDLGMIMDSGTYYTDLSGNRFDSYEAAVASSEKKKIENPDIKGKDVIIHSNHVGIYVGKDEDGNDIWCHCRGGAFQTVVVDHYDKFHYYYRVEQGD